MAIVSDVNRQVMAALGRAGYLNNDVTLVVGVSGGADSSTLLYSLGQLSSLGGFKLHVAHLNHDFRGEEADADARFVANLAQELGLPVSVEKQDPIAYQRERGISSFEQGAREMRYAFMAAVAQQVGAVAVAVGHTADDLAETVLLHLLRGAGLPGLRGMTELAAWPWPPGLATPALFRPLLAVNKADTIAYCDELGRDFRQDSGNYLFRFTRNRVRQDLMPRLAAEYNPRVREALVRLARTTASELDYLEGEIERLWPAIVISEPASPPEEANSDKVNFDRDAIADLHPALRRLALRRAYALLSGHTRRLRENHLKAMSDLAEARTSGQSLDLPGGLKLRSFAHRLTLSRNWDGMDCPYPHLDGAPSLPLVSELNRETTTEVGGWRVAQCLLPFTELTSMQTDTPFTVYLDGRVLGAELRLRSRRPGDRFQPLGMAGTKKLQDFFTDSQVPRLWRNRIPLLVANGRIAWVVGYRIAEWAKVKSNSHPDAPALRIAFERSD